MHDLGRLGAVAAFAHCALECVEEAAGLWNLQVRCFESFLLLGLLTLVRVLVAEGK